MVKGGLDELKLIWAQLRIQVAFHKKTKEEEKFWFVLPKQILRQETDIQEFTDSSLDSAKQRIEQHEMRGSGWIFTDITNVQLCLCKSRPLLGSSYIPTPNSLKKKRALINVKNSDQACLKWSILSAMFPAQVNPDRVGKYKQHEQALNMEGIPTPTPLDRRVFQNLLQQNPNLHINVYQYQEKEGVLPFFIDPTQPQDSIDILFLPPGHFVWIKNFSRLISTYLTSHDGRVYVCRRCFANYQTEDKLNSHLQDCTLLSPGKAVRKSVPHCRKCEDYDVNCGECLDKTKLSYRRYHTQQIIPVYLVADFESFSRKLPDHETTGLISQHVPLTYGIKIVVSPPYRHLPCFQPFIGKVQVGRYKENLSKEFLERVLRLGSRLKATIRDQQVPLKWREGEKEMFEEAVDCHICHKTLDDSRVPDHDHLNGHFRGAAHSACNLNYNLKNLKIPIIFHNLKGFDSKMIMTDIGMMEEKWQKNLSVLVQNSEQFKSLSLGGITFIDSLQHLPCSLDQLTKNLVNKGVSPETFPHLHMEFGHLPPEKFALLLRKGVFPYSWVDSPDKLLQSSLPSREAFFNDLSSEECSQQDYAHAQSIWREFEMETFQDYLELYLRTDVLLLADVMEGYQRLTLKNFDLEPLWYMTAAALTFDAALKFTGVTLELPTDIDMVNFLMKGVRGGLSYIAKRRSVANLPGDNFDPSKPQQHLLYIDCNNLYGRALSKKMPVGGFQWLPSEWRPPEVKGTFQEMMQERESDSNGYILEVDAFFPEDIHEWQSDFPFLPEKMIPPGGKFPKLVNHLMERKRYVITLEMYYLAQQQGVKFTAIHRALQYRQENWIAPYVAYNTRMRQDSTDSFSSDYHKLLNNALFGKTLQDVTKYVDFELFSSIKSKKYRKLNHQQPFRIKRKIVYHRCDMHRENPLSEECSDASRCVVGLEKERLRITFTKPIAIGFKVLDLSKVIMFDIFYNVLKTHFQSRMKLCMTDTDSFILEIQTDDLTQDLRTLSEHLDLSNYPQDHVLFDPQNKKVPGKMKNEYPANTLTKFIGLRSKCYALEDLDGSICKRAKGTKRHVVQNELSVEDYEKCLDEQIGIYRSQTTLRSINQTMFTVKRPRLALGAVDDKRQTLPDGENTIPWGFKVS